MPTPNMPWMSLTVRPLILVFVVFVCLSSVNAFVVSPSSSRKSSSSWHQLHKTGGSQESLGRVRHFVNLSNGIEAIQPLLRQGVRLEEISFLRIQSSHCEACHFTGILQDVDHNLLMNLALGHTCLVYDFGSRGTQWPDGSVGIPRAVWWGLEWISFYLGRCWDLDMRDEVIVRGYNVSAQWDHQARNVPKQLAKKFKYYRRFVLDRKPPKLFGVFSATDLDGEAATYVDMIATACVAEDGAVKERGALLQLVQSSIPPGMAVYDARKFDHVGRGGSGSSPPPHHKDTV